MELRRADVGFGRVIVDDRGVTRRGLFRTRSLAWDDIRDYRLTIQLRGLAPDALYVLDSGLADVLWLTDAIRAAQGQSRVAFGIELHGDGGRRLEFNWRRFRGTTLAIAAILARIAERLAAPARAELAAHGTVRFGPLQLARHGVQWGDDPPLAREAIESIELFDTSPVRLRVMARGKVWPYGQAPTRRIPNLTAALELAESLAYRVRGRELFAALGR
jgi:hypothetical protein